MTNPANDTSELTAYALGELHARQATEIHQLLSQCPAATSELEQIEAVTDALRQRAPMPQERLHPEQRHAVLYPRHLPRRAVPMMPRPPVKKGSGFWPAVNVICRAAAVIAIAAFAYWAGRQESHVREVLAEKGAALATVSSVPKAPTMSPAPVAKAEPVRVAITPMPKPEIKPVEVASMQDSAVRPAPKAPVTVVMTPPPSAIAEPKLEMATAVLTPQAPPPSVPEAITHLNGNVAFINTSKQVEDQFLLRPSEIRPPRVKAARQTSFASPAQLPVTAKTEAKTRGEDVYIHSWKAEITSCPWNKATRLLRITVQLPADQPASFTAQAYPLKVSFDLRQVREFRRLSERHVPAAELRSAGTQVVWYEFQPVNEEVPAAGKTVASVILDKGRFTTQSVGPFDGSKLNVMDRGAAWTSAREDFLFESAVVGFGMLLRGDPHSPALNHQLVLSLAEKGKGSDPTGERARFIRQLNEARRAAGL